MPISSKTINTIIAVFFIWFISNEIALGQCNTNEIEVIINIVPDNYPAETSWDVIIQGGGVVASGAFNSDTFCLSDQNCYDFTIYDQFGDGICCAYGNGSYSVYVDGVLVNSGGTFGSSETTSFNCPPVAHDLPLFVINTLGQNIPDEPGIIAEMGIIDNSNGINFLTDPFTHYDGFVDIELRGQTSQSFFPKKSYGFETTDQFGNDYDTSLLGFPTEEDWILSGPYSDKSLMRNPIVMNIARKMGYYASRTKHCELYINNEYRGVYLLMEKIKRDKNRVNIAKLDSTEISGDDLTGGYIFKIDKGTDPGWPSQFGVYTAPWNKIQFKYVYPKPIKIVTQQQQYIRSYVDSFELALASSTWMFGDKRYDEYIDINSFVDNYIINELVKNVDAYRISSYFHKDKNSKGGKLVSMPVWDYNLALNNANYCNGDNYTGWVYDQHCDDGNPFWYHKMRQDTAFQDILKCRWDKWRDSMIIDTSYLFNFMDSIANLLTNAQQRNFTKWPILGTYVWPNPTPLLNTYDEELDRIKTFLTNRIAWMDSNITGNPDCSLYEPEPEPIPDQIAEMKYKGIDIYPNPTTGIIHITSESSKIDKLIVYNSLGVKLILDSNVNQMDVSTLPAGTYILRIETVERGNVMKKFIKL